jgi:hypothetical protein
MGDDAAIRIVHHTTVERARFIAHGGTELEVGPDCMFAYDVEVRDLLSKLSLLIQRRQS